MRTSKPISTISYNSVEFLEMKLKELYNTGWISDWFFICHKKEEDESKDHIHLWVKPNRLMDTVDFQKFFHEFDSKNPDKPLKCIDFCYSDCDNALLYFIHDKMYLAMKGQTRQYHYLKEDFHVCDEDCFQESYNHAYRGSDFAVRMQQIESIKNNQDDLSSLIDSGLIPLGMAGNLCAYSNLKVNDKLNKTYRNKRKGHE